MQAATSTLATRQRTWGLFFAMSLPLAWLSFQVGQSDFWQILTCYGLFFTLYARGCLGLFQTDFRFWLYVAVGWRLMLVFAFPKLSNDVYRFIWDGRLLLQGFNPFDQLPSWHLEHGTPGLERSLFEAFGAKDSYTCYPPLAQAQFVSSCWLFPESTYWSAVAMKGWLFLFELGNIWLMLRLLRRWNMPTQRVFWYALNPLVLMEVSGNLHFEGAMLFFLLLAIFFLTPATDLGFGDSVTVEPYCGKGWAMPLAALAFALSICAKLLTAMFLPFFIKRMGAKSSAFYFLLVGGLTLLFFLPLLNETFGANIGSSLGLYFRKMEFNGSLYYLARWVGWQVKGYNVIGTIGPFLGLLAMLSILTLAFLEKKPSWEKLPQSLLFAFCIYLSCVTTLHPWYLVMPLGLCVLTRFRFPVAWSGMVVLTYINYSYQPYQEVLWVVGLEYVLVAAWLLFELWSAQVKILRRRNFLKKNFFKIFL